MRTPQDFPEFRAADEKVRALEEKQRQKQNRKNAIQEEHSSASPAARVAFGPDWRDEFSQIERHEPLMAHEIELARRKLDSIHGQVSLQICQEVRPLFIAQIKRVLRSLKELSEANDELVRLRDELEQAGITTGSITVAHSRWTNGTTCMVAV